MTHLETTRRRTLSKYSRRNINCLLLRMLTSSLEPLDYCIEYLKGKSPGTQSHAVWHFRRFFDWKVKRSKAINPVATLTRPLVKREKLPYWPYDEKEMQRLLDLKMSRQERILVGLLCEAPLQLTELRQLQKKHFTKNAIVLEDGRTLPLSPALYEMAKRTFSRNKQIFLFQSPKLTPTPLTESRLQIMLVDILNRAGLKIPGASFKIFREAFFLNSYYDRDKLLEISGVSDIRTLRGRVKQIKPLIVQLYEAALYQSRDRRYRGIK